MSHGDATVKVFMLTALFAFTLAHLSASALPSTDLEAVGVRLASAANTQEMDALVNKAEQERRAAASRLTDLLGSAISDDVRIRACYLVGVLGDAASVDALTPLLDLGYFPNRHAEHKLTVHPLEGYTCGAALVQLSLPVVKDRLVGVIEHPANICQRDQALWLLNYLESSGHLHTAAAEPEVEDDLRAAELSAGREGTAELEAARAAFRARKYVMNCRIVAGDAPPAPRHVPVEKLENTVERLRSAKSRDDLDGITYGVEDLRQAVLKSLFGVLRSSAPGPIKGRACFLLGQFHAPGDELLIANVSVDWPDGRDRHPCEAALAQTWVTSSPYVMTALATVDDPEARQRLARIVVGWWGSAGAAERIKEYINNSRSPRMTQRLTEALTLIDSSHGKVRS